MIDPYVIDAAKIPSAGRVVGDDRHVCSAGVMIITNGHS